MEIKNRLENKKYDRETSIAHQELQYLLSKLDYAMDWEDFSEQYLIGMEIAKVSENLKDHLIKINDSK